MGSIKQPRSCMDDAMGKKYILKFLSLIRVAAAQPKSLNSTLGCLSNRNGEKKKKKKKRKGSAVLPCCAPSAS